LLTKKKVSVSLTFELLKAIEEKQGIANRSFFIEQGMRDYLQTAHGVNVKVPKVE